VALYQQKLEAKGGWLSDAACQARLVYINGRFTPQLSKTTDSAKNLDSLDGVSEEALSYLARLTDGFTDQLAVPVPIGSNMFWSSHKALSGPDHCVGDPTSQFAINTQQGTACFAALNTIRTGGVAFVNVPPAGSEKVLEPPKPVLVVNAVTKDGGASSSSSVDSGVSFHPRCLVIAGENSTLSFVQSCVDLDKEGEDHPTFFNGYSQLFIKAFANVTHSYLEESGGLVTAGVEKSDANVAQGEPIPREVEANRPALKDTHFEIIDVHCMGDDARYEGTIMSVGGSGRTRVSHSVSLLKPGTFAKINGFALSGGAQRTDCKTNIHHIAQGTTSRQVQKNLIGGRATGSFRGRIRVEQSAQQTDSQQLSRSVLLSDKSRAWTVPSLEIIADDVQCTHGATVADLSEEELFYLRSRGLDRTLSRNLLMYAFASDVCTCAEPAMIQSVDSAQGLQQRLIQRLQNVVPQGDRAIKGEFQSS
jgi:Fe-S cluster assembly scaffold protein SufB